MLTPKDIFNVAFTFGNDSGYLSDPYRNTGFRVFVPDWGLPERRPSHRNKEVLFTSITHHFDRLDASLEGSYRFYHDSYGVSAHTLGLTWHQKLGQHLIIEPLFRFYEQSAASFYQTFIPASFPQYLSYYASGYPAYNSSDYRLSNLYSTDCGLQVTYVINDHIHLIAGYHRYEMNGLDHVTSPEMYPKANVFSVGLSILW